MKLQNLLDGVEVSELIGDSNSEIVGIVSDHREVKENYAFLCYQGLNVDGHDFIPGAIKNGAKVIISERPIQSLPAGVTNVITPNGRRAQAICAGNWYRNPTNNLKLIGITGTNGKTSTAHLSYSILRSQGYKVAVLGTVGHSYETQTSPDKKKHKEKIQIPALLTTPDAFKLNAIFRELVDSGVEYVVMETSSQGLAQHRLAGLSFHTAVFTNFTQDHLDYHNTMEEYLDAKLMLFDQLESDGIAILNSDSSVKNQIVERISNQHILTYGIKTKADLTPHAIDISLKELTFTTFITENIKNLLNTSCNHIHTRLQLLGSYNIYNALAAIGVGLRYNCSEQAISDGLASTVVPGRFERVSTANGNNEFAVIVDYAHTPDGLENVLTAARDISDGRLISVFGCGGDRDKSKRAKMGKISTDIADFSVITSDNPRTENPDEIISDIVSNLPHDAAFICISDRRKAIQQAILKAEKNDVVVIAGKGHEDYQEINGQRFPFDDRRVASDILQHIHTDDMNS
ncbi:UDP-N-acetylmuramoyl-L-alanyl-D-glutamate--2,6-diaminopimelate ligase [Candidatus Poribacteria bacterium]|nr:MAG: UDP-N-acetylmuramoyl-L-alanyl-D-glutamate--2,6-diaminopimelate ligase [Candidatus Poribacteria bacterium]